MARELVLVLLLGMLLVVLLIVAVGGRPIDQRRVERFATRQRLRLTAVNGPHVVRALAITHRWRRFGLATGLGLGILWAAVVHQAFTIELGWMFLGWFAGAVIAEWRISALPVEGSRRSAGLATRSLSSYVTGGNRLLLWSVLALLGIGAAAALVGVARNAGSVSVGPMDWAWPTTQVLLAGAGLWLTVRRIVGRSQPVADPDLIEADDALRGHALTVLTGCAIAAAGMVLFDFIATAFIGLGVEDAESGVALGAVTMLGLMALGWWVAARSSSARADRPLSAERVMTP